MKAFHPGTKLFVTIDSKFKDVIKTPGGLILYQDTTFNPGWHTTVDGYISSLPAKLDKSLELFPGDNIAFSYLVVYDQDFRDDQYDVFYEDATVYANVQTWSNKKGMVILCRYNKNNNWDMVVFDTEGKIYQKENGGESIIEKVKGQYTFAETTDIYYRNVLPLFDQDYWMVDQQFVYAVKRGDEITMLNNYVLLDPPPASVTGKTNAGLILLNDRRAFSDKEMHAKIINIGSNGLGLKVGDTAVVSSEIVQQYTFWGRPYLMVRQDQIMGKC